MNINKFNFEKASAKHQAIIFQWLAEPHMQAFWDNSQEHKDDIINFIEGRKIPSTYFNGIFTYWVGSLSDEPFCFILTAEVKMEEALPLVWKEHLSKTGKTYSLDFGIGNTHFLGKGLAGATLNAFTEFFKKFIDGQTDTFFIDPDNNNPKAKHVYEKAGFKVVGEYQAAGKYWDFNADKTYLMVKKMLPTKSDSGIG